jgi:pimeloyl-ACP methyl ester carboxylesterase
MPFADVGDVSLYYEFTGPEDKPLILQFGGSLFGRANFDSVNDGFRENFRLLSYDASGYGRSTQPLTSYSVEGWADEAAGLLEALGIDRVLTHGTSMGGMVGIAFTAKYPDHVIASCADCGMVRCDTYRRLLFRNWRQQCEALPMDDFCDLLTIQAVGADFVEAHPEVFDAVKRIVNANSPYTVRQACLAMETMDLEPLVGGIRRPLLLTNGSTDIMTPSRLAPSGFSAAQVAERVPDWARLHEFPDIGHADLLEIPDEAVRVVTAFFREIRAGAVEGAGGHATVAAVRRRDGTRVPLGSARVLAEERRDGLRVVGRRVEDRRVVAALDDVRLAVGEVVGDPLLAGAVGALVPRRHDVLVTADDERRRRDLAHPVAVVHGVHGLARLDHHAVLVGVAQDLLDHVDPGLTLGRGHVAARQALPRDELGEDAAAAALELDEVDPVLEDEATGEAELRGGAVDDDGLHAVGVLAGDDRGDHAAHRRAVDVGLADPERVEHADRVVGPELEVVGLLGLLGLPVAPLVVVDAAELLGEDRRDRAEVEVPEPRAVDLQDGLPVPRDLVPEPRPADLDVIARHRVSSRGQTAAGSICPTSALPRFRR